MQFFKVLDKDNRTYRGYLHDPSAELPILTGVGMCANGYHACLDPTKWRGSIPYADVRVWLVELGGEIVADGEKVAAGEMRWIAELDWQWPFLPAFPALRALLAARWRVQNPDDNWPSWADLTDANLTRANLARADLTGANLTGATLTGATLTGAYLTGAYLTGATLTGAYLARADLAGADLAGANLARADLAGANLASANLVGADLAGADLAGANLVDADLGKWERGQDGFARRKAKATA